MPSVAYLTSEYEISQVVLGILAEKTSGSAKYRELISEIPSRIHLTSADVAQSSTRPGEEVWEQRVRNIRSHQKAEGNFIANGYLEPIRGGLKITQAGRVIIKKLVK